MFPSTSPVQDKLKYLIRDAWLAPENMHQQCSLTIQKKSHACK
jgi:hypothetical protein